LEQKSPDFAKFMACPHVQGGVEQCEQGERGGQFCADVFYGLSKFIAGYMLRFFPTNRVGIVIKNIVL